MDSRTVSQPSTLQDANEILRDLNARVQLEVRGKSLNLRGTFPLEGGGMDIRRQQRIPTGLPEGNLSPAMDIALTVADILRSDPVNFWDRIYSAYPFLRTKKQKTGHRTSDVRSSRDRLLGEDLTPTSRQANAVHRTATCWGWIIVRCTDQSHPDYQNYGGRGINVCDRWSCENGLENFIRDMGPKPPFSEIDRIDNSLGYFPENCRWTDSTTQQRNKRTNKIVQYHGETWKLVELSEVKCLDHDAVLNRLKRGWTADDAIDTPGIGAWDDYLVRLARKRSDPRAKIYNRRSRKKKIAQALAALDNQ